MTHYVPISQVLDVLAPLLAVHHYVVLVGCGGAGGADCGAVHAASRMVAPTLLARTSFRTSFGQTILGENLVGCCWLRWRRGTGRVTRPRKSGVRAKSFGALGPNPGRVMPPFLCEICALI